LRALEKLRSEDRAIVFFEAARRLVACLEDVRSVLGDREAVVGREITKLHEEILRGTLGAVLERLRSRPAVKGEATVIVAAAPGEKGRSEAAGALAEEIAALSASGLSLKQTARLLGKRHGLPARQVYAEGLRLRRPT